LAYPNRVNFLSANIRWKIRSRFDAIVSRILAFFLRQPFTGQPQFFKRNDVHVDSPINHKEITVFTAGPIKKNMLSFPTKALEK